MSVRSRVVALLNTFTVRLVPCYLCSWDNVCCDAAHRLVSYCFVQTHLLRFLILLSTGMWCRLNRVVLNQKRSSTLDALRQQCGCGLSAAGFACSFTCGACLLQSSCQNGECKFLDCGYHFDADWSVLESINIPLWNFHLVFFSRRSWNV